MPDNDYIKLKNGEKFYFKNQNKEVKIKDFSNLALSWSVFFDDNVSDALTSSEIGLIFDKVKEYAMSDGNKKFSEDEMNAFINDFCAQQLQQSTGETPKDLGLNTKSLVQFLTELQINLNKPEPTQTHKNNELFEYILSIFPEIEDLKNEEEVFFLETDDGYKAKISNGKIIEFTDGNTQFYFENETLIASQIGKIGDSDFERNLYTDGELWRTLDSYGNTIYNDRMVEIFEQLTKPNLDIEKIQTLITTSAKNKQIGQDMEDYFAMTGNELFNDIAFANIPEKIKEQLLDIIYGDFDKIKGYNPELVIENSQINNDYYVGDEYALRYNGPVIYIENKTTGEETRLNLQKLLQLENFTRDQRNKFIKEIQKLPAEVLENLAIEIAYIKAIKEENTYIVIGSEFQAGATYDKDVMDIFIPKGEFLIHELGHALDHIFYGDSFDFDTFASMDSEFKAKYDELVTRYEAKGNKRFNLNNPYEQKVSRKTGDNYMTLDEREGFAICFQAMMGCDDLQTKFLFKEMPELMDYAIEHYRNIRSMKKEYRFRNLPEMRNENNY